MTKPTQLRLLAGAPPRPKGARRAAQVDLTLNGTVADARFQAFHERNPHVYRELVRVARDMKAKGLKKLGIGAVYEVARWEWRKATVDPTSDFKLNNNYRSRYARLIMKSEPDLNEAFDTRKLYS